jgi:hypothetical protein
MVKAQSCSNGEQPLGAEMHLRGLAKTSGLLHDVPVAGALQTHPSITPAEPESAEVPD